MRLVPRSLQSRLAVLFTLASAFLIVVLGAGLYLVLDRALLGAIDQGLQSRSDDLAVFATEDQGELPDTDPFAQVITADGRVVDQAPSNSGEAAVLSVDQLGNIKGETWLETDVRVLGGPSRLLARPVRVGTVPMTLVVGSSLDSYDRARERLALVLVVTSPIVIGALAGAGWLLSGAALRPVRRLTQQADEITVNELGRRLPTEGTTDEIGDLARTLNAMLDRIESSVAHERRFVDDASHELRTPISILRGELELALARPGDEAEVIAGLRSALDEAVRLGRLAEDLLTLARARTGQLGTRPAPVDLGLAAERVASMMGRDQLIRVEGSAMVWADPDRVDQILVNLLGNAARYAESQVVVTVTRGDDDQAGPTLAVADDGPGFAPSILPITFGRFARADSARGRETGGTGLGLAITAALARAQGATVEAGNGPPLGGAVVRVGFRPAPVERGVAVPN
jgi:signal transduction histidine kinase